VLGVGSGPASEVLADSDVEGCEARWEHGGVVDEAMEEGLGRRP
jgi:hypothetical protein